MSALIDEPRHRRRAAGRRLHLADVGADHHARERRRGFLARIAGRDLLAAAQDRRGVAKPLHLVELVADVENRAAFALEPFEHDEELVGFLRRQHRGRLIENQQLRILHQRAHDLDALALADRQPPHLAVRVRAASRRRATPRPAAPKSRRTIRSAPSPSATFSATVRFSNSEKCWNTMPMPSARACEGPASSIFSPQPAQFARRRLHEPVHDLDQRRLAGAVLAEQRVNFGRKEVDAD